MVRVDGSIYGLRWLINDVGIDTSLIVKMWF